MTGRDDFPAAIRRRLEQQVASMCSWPGCNQPTRGAATGDAEGVVNIGIAAHITAAAAGGPRYEPRLTPTQRKSAENGIWLCVNHARLIDVDALAYPVDKLRAWKRDAKARSALRIAQGPAATLPVPALDGGLGEASAQDIRLRLQTMARQDLDAFRRDPRWPIHAVELRLRLTQGRDSQVFHIEQVATKLSSFDDAVLVAPPGTGKSTTLIQLAEAIVAEGAAVPCVVPLPEWAALPGTPLLSAVLRHAAFAKAREEELRLLASQGALVLLLDGWNEVDAATRQRARQELRALRRDFPDLSRVIGTRRQSVAPLFDDSLVVEVESLDDTQQREIACALRGVEGERLLVRARRADGVRELTRVPLFLTAMLAADDLTVAPHTKEAVLAAFVAAEERRAHGRGEALRQGTLGFHREALRALAVHGVATGATILTDAMARPVVQRVYVALVRAEQLSAPPDPGSVLDALVAEHLLVRTGDGGLMFQHQQFQEWFASFEVSALMRASAADDPDATHRLRVDILDQRAWEEPILFACQRLAAVEEDQAAVAHVIRLALRIDPMLAADMIYVSPPVWRHVAEEVLTFAARWHVPDTVDRAVGFMNSTGRPEFLATLTPLFASPDTQLHLSAYRAGRRFDPGLFGSAAADYLLGYPERQQLELLLELFQRGGASGAELALETAIRSSYPEVRAAVAEELYHRSADSELLRLLAGDDGLWTALATRVEPGANLPPELSERLQLERHRYLVTQTDSAQRLYLLLHASDRPDDFDAQLDAVLRDPDLAMEADHVRSSLHQAAGERPDLVAQALLARAECGLALPYGAADLAKSAGLLTDALALRAALLDSRTALPLTGFAATIAGPATVTALLDGFLDAHRHSQGIAGGRIDAHADEHFRLRSLLHVSPLTSLVTAISARPIDSDPTTIELLAGLLSGNQRERGAALDPTRQALCNAVLQTWAQAVLDSRDSRSVGAAVAAAIGAVGSVELAPTLLQLLTHDLEEWQRERDREDRQRTMWSFTLQFQRALVALGGETIVKGMLGHLVDPHFGYEAAAVLRDLQLRGEASAQPGAMVDYSFLGLMARRGSSAGVDLTGSIDAHAAAIFAAADTLAEQGHCDQALRLGSVAVQLPCGDPTPRVKAFLQLSSCTQAKLDLVRHYVLAVGFADANTIKASLDDVLAAGVQQPWLLDPEQGPVGDWIALLPFSDRPELVLPALASLPPAYQAPYRQRNLLRALGIAGGAANEDVLFALAQADRRYLESYDWWQALKALHRVTVAARILQWVVSPTDDPQFGRGHDTAMQMRDTLVFGLDASPDFRRDLYRELDQQTASPAGELLAGSVAEAPDIEGILLLVRYRARTSDQLGNALYAGLKALALSHEPSPTWQGAFNVGGVPTTELRRRLYEVACTADPGAASVASSCLVTLDEFRDEWGVVDLEPRHPDIASGNAWPLLSECAGSEEAVAPGAL